MKRKLNDSTQLEKKEKFKVLEKKFKNHNFITPTESFISFYNWKEWKYVKDLLFEEKFEEAKRRISIWKMKYKKLPHSIESTYNFLSINSTKNTERSLALGLAIVRMVDGFSQTLQDQRFYNSIHLVLESINFPNEIVTIRHQCAHSDLPSLSVLEKTAKAAMEWLNVNYWQEQSDLIEYFELTILDSLRDQTLNLYVNENSRIEIVDIIVENIILKSDHNENQDLSYFLKDLETINSWLVRRLDVLIGNEKEISKDEKDLLVNWRKFLQKK